MDFFGIGFGEVLLILVLALIIWGPRRLPEIARTLGRTVRTLKRATSDFTSQITGEIDIEKPESREKGQPAPPRENRTADTNAAKDE